MEGLILAFYLPHSSWENSLKSCRRSADTWQLWKSQLSFFTAHKQKQRHRSCLPYSLKPSSCLHLNWRLANIRSHLRGYFFACFKSFWGCQALVRLEVQIYTHIHTACPPPTRARLARTESLSAGTAEVWATSCCCMCVRAYVCVRARMCLCTFCSQPASHAHSSQGTPPTCL